MTINTKISRLIALYRSGVYTLREILPQLAIAISKDEACELINFLPEDIQASFAAWINEYPLEGGIQIRDTREIPIETIIELKSELKKFKMNVNH